MNKPQLFKYPSLENHYRESCRKGLPESGVWAIQEKIDGSNLQVIITHDSIHFASRNQMLGKDSNFQGVNLEQLFSTGKLGEFITNLQERIFSANPDLIEVRLFGELFSRSILRRIPYNTAGDWKLFDVAYIYASGDIDYIYSDDLFYDTYALSLYPLFDEIYVPVTYVTGTLDEAIAKAVRFNEEEKHSNYAPAPAEGYVIKLISPIVYGFNKSPVYVKVKSEKFIDKESAPKPKVEILPRLLQLQEAFATYINENRVLDSFAKHGQIQDKNQIGNFIALIVADALNDFSIDYPEYLELNKADQKIIYSQSGKAVKTLLDKSLQEERKIA